MKLKIWYSVRNGGDGSAYPTFMESEELCEIDQEFLDEGWGEPCVGSITVESDSPIVVVDEIETVASMIKDTEEDLKYTCNAPLSTLRNKLKALKELQVKKDEYII